MKALTSIAENGVSEAARVSAANSLLDRAYGKPVQAMAHSGPGEGSIETVVEMTPKELARRLLFIIASAAEEQRKERERDAESKSC